VDVSFYLDPARSLVENFGFKVLVAVLALPLTHWMESLEGALISTPLPLLFIVALLWLLDLVSGLVQTIRLDGMKSVTSFRLRQTIIKFIEYAIFIVACGLFASTGKHAPPLLAAAIKQIDEIACIIIAATELKSIDENLKVGFLKRVRQILDVGGLLSSDDDEDER